MTAPRDRTNDGIPGDAPQKMDLVHTQEEAMRGMEDGERLKETKKAEIRKARDRGRVDHA